MLSSPILDGNFLETERYFNDSDDPLIIETVETNPNKFEWEFVLQHDGAPPHYSK